MSDPSADPAVLANYARAVLRENLGVKKGEHVIIEGWTHTLPWAVALAREARRIGAFPIVPYEDEEAYWSAVDAGEERVVGAAPRHEWAALGATDVYIHMWGPADRVRLNRLPEKRLDRLVGFNEAWYAAARKAHLRGARLEIGRPYPTLAEVYGVDQRTWSEQVVAATLVPPKSLAKAAAPIARALERGRRIHLADGHGTDLTLGLAHRRPTVNWGRPDAATRASRYGMLLSLPAGLVRVALDEKVADGTIVANRTNYYDDGRATGARFEFSGGRLTEATFATGGERFDAAFRKAGKGRDQPGILSIGLNPALHDTPQLEDVERGAVLVSVGGNQQLGGKNTADLFAWAINAGASVEVDGRPLDLAGP